MRPHLVFLLIALIELVLAHLVGDDTHTISMHDTYLVVAREHVRMSLALLALLFAALYALMDRAGRPISPRLGILHLGLTVLGLLLPSVAMIWSGLAGDQVPSILVLSGMLSLLVGLLVFVVGLVLALRRVRSS